MDSNRRTASRRLPGLAQAVAGMCWWAALAAPASAQICATPPAPGTPPCVLTSQYDNLRDGHNGYETLLTSTGLSGGTVTLSKPSWSPLAVDTNDLPSGQTDNPIYAQPLYVSQIQVGGAVHNMVIAATLNDTIYAWDADNGTLLWNRQGTTRPPGQNSLWDDDCGARGGAVPLAAAWPNGAKGHALPFAGIVATPVIEITSTASQMYVTDFCSTSTKVKEWWLHQIDLTTGYDIGKIQLSGSDTVQGNTVTFEASEELQRSALLLVAPPGAQPSHVIYIAFGTAVPEDSSTNPYHGWLLGYTNDSTGALSEVFAFASTPSSTNTGTPACDSTITSGYQNAPNWCGHGGGIWMSGRGPAASLPGGKGHVYLGVGNGGYQTKGLNWGESILDFELSASGASAKPVDFFTPWGGLPVEPPLEDGVQYTYQSLNVNDLDMSVSGILLFDDSGGNHWLVTVDKAGYGYLLDQSHLGGFSSGDPGDVFPFGASPVLCTGTAAQCSRVVSLAYYNNTLYFWPNESVLIGFQYYNSSVDLQGQGTITSSGAKVTGLNFPNQVVVGDTLTAGGQKVIVTAVRPNSVTVSPAFSPDVVNSTFTYNGMFVNPFAATVPAAKGTGYPGGLLSITSNGAAAGSGIVWAIAPAPGTDQFVRGPGTLYAYDAATLNLLWSSPDTFTESAYGLPTVVNGNAYVPTYNEGVLVYTGAQQ